MITAARRLSLQREMKRFAGAAAGLAVMFLLLFVAFLADKVGINFTIGGFPPKFTADAFVGALLGSIVISIVSIVLGMLDRGRRIVV